MLSQPMEDYLTAIYRAESRGEKVTTSHIASKLGVSAASTTAMFQKLATEGLVEYKEYAGVSLTQKGQKAALDIIRRHRLAERFLTDILDIPWDRVDAMAHKMEHVLPKEVIEGFDRILGNPRTCPHGYPIPSQDGAIAEVAVRELSDLRPGESGVIARVAEDDPELLRYLAACHLVPGAELTVIDKPPFDEPMTLKVGGESLVIGPRIARSVFIRLDTPIPTAAGQSPES